MSNGQQPRSEAIASAAPVASKIPLLGGAGAGVVLAAGLAFFFWPASEGRVVFDLEPDHAEVTLLEKDGPRVLTPGATAVTAVLEAGSHRAEVTAEGYVPAAIDFEIVGGELHHVAVTLEVAVEAVEFAIEPPSAVLEITPASGGDPQVLLLEDGRWRGDLALGDYLAHVTAQGHHEETIPFAVLAGKPTLLPVSLRAVARSRRGTVIVPTPGYRGPGYYGPRYYGPGYRGRRFP